MKKLTAKGMLSITGSVTLEDGTVIKDEALIQRAINGVDQDAIVAKLHEEFIASEWDRKTPINGVPAAQVLLLRRDIPAAGKVYTIRRGARVLCFQPFKPGEPGRQPMRTEGELRECMSKHLAQIIEGHALNEAKMAALNILKAMR